MKRLAIICLAVTAFAAGCQKEKSASQQLDQVQEKTEAAAQDMEDYAFARKEEFVTEMQGELDEINQNLDLLAAKIEKSTDAAKAEAEPKLKVLREQMTKLKRQLEEARKADESAWDDVKSGFRKGYGELKEGFKNSRQWVSDKIAP